uniref:Uncharacterized protein n=1 Tax=Leptocylindrus danicus TaxID=163516 RepID=A0A7S2PI47_9STRA
MRAESTFLLQPRRTIASAASGVPKILELVSIHLFVASISEPFPQILSQGDLFVLQELLRFPLKREVLREPLPAAVPNPKSSLLLGRSSPGSAPHSLPRYLPTS